MKNALGETVTKNTYDPKGNMETSIDGENNKVEYTYTLLGQIKDIVTPNSRKENKKAQSYKYDARGNITGITEGNGNQTSYDLDVWGRITQIVTPEGGTEKYTYDYAGNIITTTDANGGTITYSYNSLGQVSEIKDQEGNSEYFYYDEEGNLSKQLNRNENIVDRSYNIDKNIVSVKAYKKTIEEISKEQKILNIIDQRYNYNEDGTLKNAYTGNMLYEYNFNAEGMLESKSASGKTLLNYDYDKNNNIKTIKDITGKSSIYRYDDANRVKEIKDNSENTVVNYDYFKNDNIKSINYGNGLKTDYSYDGDGNVESLVTVTSTGEVIVDYNYAYDLNGNRIEKVSSKHKNHYTYDSMNRLKDSSYDGRQESFTYDKVGNRLSKTTNDITDKYVYNVKNQLKELNQNSGTNLFTYDKQGNTIKEESNLGVNTFEYNNLNQQVKAITKEGNTLVSRYDTEGLRCEIEENEKLTKFIFHKENVLVETDKDYNLISRFTRGYEVVAADISDGDLASEGNRYYYTHDEQGSTVFITDNEQQIKNEYCYDAFGNVLESTEDVDNRITYTGQQFDGITDQYYLRARFYNSVIGRFTQEDVYRGDGLNLYSYCGSNPVGYFDPSGYTKCPIGSNKETNFDEYQYKKKHDQTPKKGERGVWSGERGESKYIPNDKEIQRELAKYDLDGISYKNSEADFSDVALEEVKINGMSGESSLKDARKYNFKAADQELSQKSGVSIKELGKLRKKHGLTWHECNDMKTMQLVPSKINKYFGHTGGIGEINMLFDLLEGKI
ncbi:RHS repeat-associated core domain-containing protein [Clostridium estertheticum]|uniref:RHS repeat-associated core domain-containing protein n=1 Tax=Clostridium estertheticum TaxID=238834 RepID=UPI002814A37D|nr:RHS repeat-associated core domain-containing protein [Clostridium estertheticum]